MNKNKSVLKIKNISLQAYYKGMLPSKLVNEIQKITTQTEDSFIRFLKDLTYEFYRICGYYKNDMKEKCANECVSKLILEYKEKKKGENING